MILAVTGHRPDKLGGYGPAAQYNLLLFALDYLREAAPNEVITGMALGWDLAVADAAAELAIPFTAAVPFTEQERPWTPDQQVRYRDLLRRAARVHYPDPGPYALWKYQARNVWMVDSCDRLGALWNGTSGGTKNCVEYAARVGRPVDQLWPRWRQR